MATVTVETLSNLLPNWIVSDQAPEGYVYICPPDWAYNKTPCIHWACGTNVCNLDQVQTCLDYYASTADDRAEYQKFVEMNGGEKGLLPGALRDRVRHLELPRFN